MYTPYATYEQYVPTGTYVTFVSYALNVIFEIYVPHEYEWCIKECNKYVLSI
jgi:hypothetical protein